MELSPAELLALLTLLNREYQDISPELLRNIAANSPSSNPKAFLAKLINKLDKEYENS